MAQVSSGQLAPEVFFKTGVWTQLRRTGHLYRDHCETDLGTQRKPLRRYVCIRGIIRAAGSARARRGPLGESGIVLALHLHSLAKLFAAARALRARDSTK